MNPGPVSGRSAPRGRPAPPSRSTARRGTAGGSVPARWAARPAATASRMASAMAAGAWARLTEVATSTASHPSSIARAASEAVPTPASRTTGTETDWRRRARLWGFRMPRPLPIGRAQRHHRRAARLLEPAGQHRVVGGVGQDHEPVLGQLLGGREQLDRVGQERPVVTDHLELHPVGGEGLPGQLGREHGLGGREAPGGVGQDPDPVVGQQVEEGDRVRRGRPAARPPWPGRSPRRPGPTRGRPGWSSPPCPPAASRRRSRRR